MCQFQFPVCYLVRITGCIPLGCCEQELNTMMLCQVVRPVASKQAPSKCRCGSNAEFGLLTNPTQVSPMLWMFNLGLQLSKGPLAMWLTLQSVPDRSCCPLHHSWVQCSVSVDYSQVHSRNLCFGLTLTSWLIRAGQPGVAGNIYSLGVRHRWYLIQPCQLFPRSQPRCVANISTKAIIRIGWSLFETRT